jgi:glycosidase
MLISRFARQKYQFDLDFFRPDGRAAFKDYSAARRFAEQMSAHRADPVPASDIQAMALLDEVLCILLRQYELQNPGLLTRALGYIQAGLGEPLDTTLVRFIEEFPPLAVAGGVVSALQHLEVATDGRSHRQIAVEEWLLIHVNNQNPAIHPYRDLFDDSPLKSPAYDKALTLLGRFLSHQPPFSGSTQRGGETLLDLLTAPAKASPYSLEGQLQFILDKWGFLLGESFILRILRGMDFIREEVIRHAGPGHFKPEAPVPTYGGADYAEYERFSPDRDWMPRLVLMAKNTYVWLEQLSRKYERWIQTLDQVPDEELDLLAQRGFTGLWLIGLWERSRASQRIKQRMGQHDAVASAYSLHSYDIAEDLGGWNALNNLRSRAWQRGLRLSADMVPNHMGIDSEWVMSHPDWFLSLPTPPYPGYTFNSEDLSDDGRAGIILEDHYYNHSDASVVFKRYDRSSGETRYIYHGNDGTSFPWNDTAQLDYSKAQVREAVIQTILHVARNFPIIRFDAAMTLAKKHIQRLWFPEPGAGGAIPSRSEHGMTKADFDAAIPEEFWREVVDRVAAEVPDTLLLAEAFWLMEGYFVRTLGMHRVYNSAFMHMLRDEDNAKYRSAIKNTLEFDPQILKRYVNFMNNPDEKTAVEQFGNGDKYFGIATVLSTLPGLPMFGHGQIEGFHEKYGMEFRKPKWEETPDDGLIRGHEWKIFPLLHRRYLFAEVEAFHLYDFYTTDGGVDENVFAYSNRHGDERGLVIYHNRYADTRGWIKVSAAALDKNSGQLVQKTLGEALDLPREGYAIFRDYTSHLEFIRPCAEIWERGIYAELAAYHCYVFMDWWFVDGEQWAEVHRALNGAGVDSVQAKYDELFAVKEEEVVEEVKVKKPRKKAAPKTKESAKKTSATKKPAAKGEKTSTASKSKKAATVKKEVATKKPAAAKKTSTTAVKKPAAPKKPVPTKTSTTKKPASKKPAKAEK